MAKKAVWVFKDYGKGAKWASLIISKGTIYEEILTSTPTRASKATVLKDIARYKQLIMEAGLDDSFGEVKDNG